MSMAGDKATVQRPCPFCGGKDIVHDNDGDSGWLRCVDCSATGGYSADAYAVGMSIEMAWDTRPLLSDTLAALSAERDALLERVDELNEIAKVAIRAAKDANDVLIELRAALDATKDQRG